MNTIRRRFIANLLLSCLFVAGASAAPSRPNVVLIFTDDQGYGDVGAYGSPNIKTPNIDQLAAEGILFTSFYSAIRCGPSRAALMTGSYPARNSMAFNSDPFNHWGIHPDEITIAELLKKRGYATLHLGKWHLGDDPEFLPSRNGFDEFFGLPHSNDMWPFADRIPLGNPPDPRHIAIMDRVKYTGSPWPTLLSAMPKKYWYPDLPLILNEQVIETNPDQSQLTKRFTKYALEFIEAHQSEPFFVYLAHPMPHVPVHASEDFIGHSLRGLYGDAVEEIDWSVGEIMAKLEELGLDENTLVIFTSDNGPWLGYGIDGGSAGPLKNGKGTSYEGGFRVPAVMRWPGKIPAGRRTSEIAANMDIFPSVAKIAGAELPADRILDGRDLTPLITGKTESGPHETFYFFGDSYTEDWQPNKIPNLLAIRKGRWKLHFQTTSGRGTGHGRELYDLGSDVGEEYNRI